ncbi:Ger(x)C family spore germination protein [Cohnella silvisoli]|nr:Ger(x)C family spore germination protein [Cohnella silvisoli]
MNRRYFIYMFISLVWVSFLTGCWNRKEMNELAIVLAAGIDKVDDRYRFSAQVVDPGQVSSRKGGGGGRAPATLYTEEADTIFEAVRKITRISPRKLYFSHLRIFVIDESLAKEGMAEVLDFLNRDHEIRSDFYIVVSKGVKAEDTLKILTAVETIPANQLFSSLDASERNWSPSMTVTIDSLIDDLISDGKNPVLTGLRVVGELETGKSKRNVENIDPPGRLRYSGLAVFKKDRLIGWLNEDESRGYNFIMDNVKSSVGNVTCPGEGKVIGEVIRANTVVKGMVYRGRPQVNINVRIEGNVGEVECATLDLTKKDTIRELEKKMGKKIGKSMESVIEKAQNSYKSDIFGFGKAIRRSNPKAWKTLKKGWDEEYFTDLRVTINVDYKIRGTGTMGKSFLNEMK